MNGKQCIFCGHSAPGYEIQEKDSTENIKDFSVFVIMPFQSTYDTFYEWSLKRYLKEGLKIENIDKQIRRADEFRDIGYVMCEKICIRIQEADLIVVDLSTENPNVMYEMGLAVGLNKPLLVICNQANKDERFTEDFQKSVGLKIDNNAFKVIEYPSVGHLDAARNNPIEAIDRVKLNPRKAEMKIVPLLIDLDTPSSPSGINESKHPQTDIKATFSEALRGAIGVATKEISESITKFPSLKDAVEILGKEELTELGIITKDKEIIIVSEEGHPQSYKDVAAHVDSSFTCIIDLAGENPSSYFWLGYCHARGINAIPISREVAPKMDNPEDKGEKDTVLLSEKREHVIAFDIRALWYIRYRPREIKELSNALKAALEELIAKDVPKQQRNIFWERLTRQPRIHIYTGAVHHGDLNREVVGDWDQRTVSELVRYLSSAEESVIPELERPIYSPGTIKSKLPDDWDWVEEKSLVAYIDLVKSELTDKNCIIVASADVNPLTEVVLAHAYGMEEACFQDPKKYQLKEALKKNPVIALKGWKTGNSGNKNLVTIPTFFSRSGRDENLDEGKRGFQINNNDKPLQELYKSQDSVSHDESPFTLLSHLVVMNNPFDSKNKDTIIVLLNGVSGPGTFGLAEILTGGNTTEKSAASESILKNFNSLWAAESAAKSADKRANKSEDKNEKSFGIESIIGVKIMPKGKTPKDIKNQDSGEVKDEKEVSNDSDGEKAISDDSNSEETISDDSNGEKAISDDTNVENEADQDKPTKSQKQAVHDKFYDLRTVVSWDFYRDEDLIAETENPRSFNIKNLQDNGGIIKAD
jgi:hypothetical protein